MYSLHNCCLSVSISLDGVDGVYFIGILQAASLKLCVQTIALIKYVFCKLCHVHRYD